MACRWPLMESMVPESGRGIPGYRTDMKPLSKVQRIIATITNGNKIFLIFVNLDLSCAACLYLSKNTAIYIFKMQNLVHNHVTFSCSINCSFIRSLIKLRLTLMPMSLADLVLANLILLDRVCKLPFLKPRTIMFVNIYLN